MKPILKRSAVILGQCLLLALFGSGLSSILADDSAEWIGITYIGIIVISGLMLIGWLIPPLRRNLWFWRTNLIWVSGWLIYFLILLGIVIIAINRLVSLG